MVCSYNLNNNYVILCIHSYRQGTKIVHQIYQIVSFIDCLYLCEEVERTEWVLFKRQTPLQKPSNQY